MSKRKYEFYKEHPTDKVYWVDNKRDLVGIIEFSFDKKKIYNLFSDYPNKLSTEEKEIFDKENPFWADFFKEKQNTLSRFAMQKVPTVKAIHNLPKFKHY